MALLSGGLGWVLHTVPLDGSAAAVAELVAALRKVLAGEGPAVLPLASRDALRSHNAVSAALEQRHGSEVRGSVVVATSGSSGGARLVVLSADSLVASAAATRARLGGDARWLLALPAEHVAGVQVIVRALLAGAAPVVQDVRTGFRPADFAAATAELPPGRRHTSLVPTQLLRLLDAGGPALDALRSFDAVLVGGAALDPALRGRAEGAGVRVVTTYGMSETAGGCVYDGVPLDGVTADLEPDGRIVLGGPTVAEGYLGGPSFEGRFRTGDLGRWRGGRLEVLGRADDVIVTGGEKVAPAAVERVLAAQPGVRDVCVVGVADPEWGHVVVAAVVPGPDRPDDDRLRDAVRAELGRAAVPRRLVDVAEIPARGIGKPDRRAVAALLTPSEDPSPTIG